MMTLVEQDSRMTEAPPVEYIELDGETYSEYEIDPSYSPPEDANIRVVLSQILHELRTMRYQLQAVLHRLDAE